MILIVGGPLGSQLLTDAASDEQDLVRRLQRSEGPRGPLAPYLHHAEGGHVLLDNLAVMTEG